MQSIYAEFLVILIFVVSLGEKLSDFSSLQATTIKKNMPFPKLAPYMAIGLLLVGVITWVGNKWQKVSNKRVARGMECLIIFTAMSTFYFHNVLIDGSQKYHFLKNLGLIGGLWLIRNRYLSRQ